METRGKAMAGSIIAFHAFRELPYLIHTSGNLSPQTTPRRGRIMQGSAQTPINIISC
jgi:hypothetical protein